MSGNLKVTFIDPCMYNLLPLWREMQTRAGVDCAWIITKEEDSFSKLQSMGVENIVFDSNEPQGEALDKLVKQLGTDVVVSSTWGRADTITLDIPKVQAFHGLGNRVYFVKPEPARRYDLLLFPSKFHKNLYIKYRVFDFDDPRLQVVGWPRIDCLYKSDFDKQEISLNHGIDPGKRTVFYAPTWSVYGQHGIFYRWFEDQFGILDRLCRYTQEMQINFVIKFHALLQKQFVRDGKFWNAILSLIGKYDHVTLIDAMQDEDPEPLLFITDVLITDISSIFVDFLAMNRPVVFIEPQLDFWEQTEICSSYRTGPVVDTPEQLLNAITDSLLNPQRYEHDRKRLFKKLVYKFDGEGAKRGVDAILELTSIGRGNRG